MLTSLEFENYRGFRRLQIKPLKRVNLIAGENNTGKTAVLEGLCLLLASNPEEVKKLPTQFRSGQQSHHDNFRSFWEWVFYEKNTDLKPSIKAETPQNQPLSTIINLHSHEQLLISEGNSRNQSTVRFQFGPQGFSHHGSVERPKFLAQTTRLGDPANDADLYNRVSLMADGEEKVLNLMKIIEPRLKKLRYSKITSRALVYAHLGFPHFIPATQMGQGFSRLLTLFSEMMVSGAKVLLIDEIENGLHYSVLTQVWKGIAALAESEDIQVFATTHSWGCIVAAHEAFAETSYDFALHRLQRIKNEVEAITYDRETLETALHSELEVR
jgi:AAA15 family ATPase/GTPase